MPKFFLHIRNGEQVIPDPEGADLPDLEAAREEAHRVALELLAEELWTADAPHGRAIEVADESGQRLHAVPLEAVLDLS